MNTRNERFYYKQDRLKQLRAFCYSAETGRISKAAERTFLSQPSVSLLVRALEKDLQAALFERNGPRIQLTPEGRMLYELATPLVEGLEALPATFMEKSRNIIVGDLHIAAGETAILYLLPDAMKRLASQCPDVHFNLHNVTARDGLALLRANEAEFMVGTLLEIPQDMEYRPLVAYDPMLITPRDHALARKREVTLEDIARYGLILPPRHLSSSRLVNLVFQQHQVPYQITLEAGGWEVIKQFVARGLGISICASLCLTGSEDLVAIPVRRYFPARNYGLILRKGKHLSPAGRNFVEVLAETKFKDNALVETRRTSVERTCENDEEPTYNWIGQLYSLRGLRGSLGHERETGHSTR
ncbi:MAG: LysR family transcriptional regulator [Chromatiales bacterium]